MHSSKSFSQSLKKPDGRRMTLYSRRPISSEITAPCPNPKPLNPKPLMRWHPLRGEWVTYAGHRQDRTFLPPPEYNPLAPSDSEEFPTEMPVGDYDAAVFENLFPSMAIQAAENNARAALERPADGVCEVVVFTRDPNCSLGTLSVDHIKLIIDIWADRTERLGSLPNIQYVMPFENRGGEVGVTLNHPHGQIYAYPMVPPIPARELQLQKRHFYETGRGLIEDVIAAELLDGRRILFSGPEAVAFVPICARYPYEVWVSPRRPVPDLILLNEKGRFDLARALKTVLLKFDGLWKKPFPYIMVIHQAPTDGEDHPEAHLHFEFYPAFRQPGRLKYVAGAEVGAGIFTNDTLPEEKAAELKAVEISLE